ncbi:leucyl aminopeptidase [Actinomycetaceae bacterium WB03_NA08]|uniref:Probable cytosol aminopeptidase n=1 Tax=Scrofimicrobium canadense TaxID=2652290 RepID=A0A6N7W4P5_9ACTO|nr:leucyl aminopeptidase [Scrofimicrobium canadense]MSS83206.1 leucyl aminopeptidase [Scrofimicrobium canadense]
MTRTPAKLIPEDFPVLPGLEKLDDLEVVLDTTDQAQAIGYLIFEDAPVPEEAGFSAEQLKELGFTPKTGEGLLLPNPHGADVIALGAGKTQDLDGPALRDIAAAAVNAAKNASRVGIVGSIKVPHAARYLVEGALLARYRYEALKSEPKHTHLEKLLLQGCDSTSADVETGRNLARATVIARDLTNTPPGYLTARDLAEAAANLAQQHQLGIEIFDNDALIEMGCGGLLGVNRGSYEPARLIKLHYSPSDPVAHIGLVGKGITYDSGGVSLKPSDQFHQVMKMDMGGAAAILGAMSSLPATQAQVEVTAWLLCTDNMISGDAYRLGDVLTAADGTTVEVKNTDAEGRLVLMDGLSLAAQEDLDAIIDVATLTGAAIVALGQDLAATFTNDDALAAIVTEASTNTGEETWRLPLEQKYRSQLDSLVADISNVGGTRFGGAIVAALFLQHFVGDTPWVHVDIAGPMNQEKPEGWRPAGATGFGARLLLDVIENYASADTSN